MLDVVEDEKSEYARIVVIEEVGEYEEAGEVKVSFERSETETAF